MDHLNKTVKELLQEYPDGFAIGYSGTLTQILMASSHLNAIASRFPIAPSDGGYMVVKEVKNDDSV